MRTLCIYHDDDDGFGAAWVVRKALHADKSGGRREVVFHPANHGQPMPEVAGRDVIIVDFSYKRAAMVGLIQEAATVLVLDHHQSAEQELAGLPEALSAEMAKRTWIHFEQGKSGVLLAWEHFFGTDRLDEPKPALIDYLDAGDLWQRHRFPDLLQVQAALRSYPYRFELWDGFMTPAGLDRLRVEGCHIRRFIDQKVAELLRTRHRIKVGDQLVPAVNAPWFLAAEIAGRLAEDAPYGITYYRGSTEEISFSLRSTGAVDVARLAQQFGGGGHANAAGFRLPAAQFDLVRP